MPISASLRPPYDASPGQLPDGEGVSSGAANKWDSNDPGIEIDVDELVGEFHSQINRLNREICRRSKELQGLTVRQARLKMLRREQKKRYKRSQVHLAGQFLDVQHQLSQVAAERTRLAAWQHELEHQVASLDSERRNLDENFRLFAIDRERLAAEDRAQRDRQSELDTARCELHLEQGRVVEQLAQIEQRQSELAAWQDRLQQRAVLLENAEAAFEGERASWTEEQRVLSEEYARRGARLAQAQAALDAAGAELRDQRRVLDESEGLLQTRWDEYNAELSSQKERRQAIDQDTARLAAETRTLNEMRSLVEADRETLAERQRLLNEEQARHDLEHAEACDRLEAERAALHAARERLASDVSELEQNRAAIRSEQQALEAEEQRIAAARGEMKERLAVLETAEEKFCQREQAMRQNEADFEQQNAQFASDKLAFQGVRQELDEERKRLEVQQRSVEELARQLALSQTQLAIDQAELGDARQTLGEQWVRLVADQKKLAAEQSAERDAQQVIERTQLAIDRERESLRAQRMEMDQKSSELNAFEERLRDMLRLAEDEKAALSQLRLDLQEQSSAAAGQTTSRMPVLDAAPRSTVPSADDRTGQAPACGHPDFDTGDPVTVDPVLAGESASSNEPGERDQVTEYMHALLRRSFRDSNTDAASESPASSVALAPARECEVALDEPMVAAQQQPVRIEVLREVANRSARSAVTASRRKRLLKSLALQIPLLVLPLTLAGMFVSTRTKWFPAWIGLAAATVVIALIASRELLITFMRASRSKPGNDSTPTSAVTTQPPKSVRVANGTTISMVR